MKKKKTINHQKGFTLLETLVAIFILTLALTGPVYIASVAFRNTIDSRDNISAQYIAEEVVEVIRNKRDRYALYQEYSSGWLADAMGTATCTNDAGFALSNKCIMLRDTTVPGNYKFEACPGGVCPNITFDPNATDGAAAVYGKANIIDRSKFTREFYFETSSNPEVKLVVTISWQDKGRTKEYTLVEWLNPINYRQFFIEN